MIIMSLKRTILLGFSSLFMLSACEGYEMIKTDKMFPYGGKRTAGSGVAYVLAKMMPEKKLKLEPVVEAVERVREPAIIEMPKAIEPKPMPEEPVPPSRAEEIFLEDAKK